MCVVKGQPTGVNSPTIWVPGIKFRLSGLEVGAFALSHLRIPELYFKELHRVGLALNHRDSVEDVC